ncbi:YcgL domain-containing protein [Dongshaea marina]|uniref:YcgL domain-containing protein n=1 Tax=Dongshaea marina TaxID=2047966 RepID=UPI000D3E43DF|nr:YcgL domain-containing protein [Dongshaea marina]
MLCAVYKSPRKAETYLFIERRDDFSSVPESLLNVFGRPQLAMMVHLDPEKPLIVGDPVTIRDQIREQGFYLHLPPKQDNLLDIHLKQQKKQKKGPECD